MSNSPTMRADDSILVSLAARCRYEDIHSRRTRIIRVRGEACGSCEAIVEPEATFCGLCGTRTRATMSLEIAKVEPRPVATQRRVFANTPAFELQPPRIIDCVIPTPAFLRGDAAPDRDAPPQGRRWGMWLVALAAWGAGAAMAVLCCT